MSLIRRAQEIAQIRQEQYGDWKETAHRYCEGDPTEYPAAMIRAKLSRDPDCRRADTRVDLVNYLAMLDEAMESKAANVPSVTEQIAEMKLERDRLRRDGERSI